MGEVVSEPGVIVLMEPSEKDDVVTMDPNSKSAMLSGSDVRNKVMFPDIFMVENVSKGWLLGPVVGVN